MSARPIHRHVVCPKGLAIWLGLAGLLAVGPAAPAQDQERPPNIVLIMADDLGYGELGCYGQKLIETPRIDELAAQGMRFTQAYAGSHVCQPSRSVLMTGLHSGHTACRANNIDQLLLDEDVTIAEILRSRGYRTGIFGKWGLGFEGTSGHPLRQGYDHFFGHLLQVHAHFYYPYWVWQDEARFELPENEGRQQAQYVHDEIHAQALRFIRDSHDQPFFAYLPYIIPHVELVVPEDSEAPYRGRFPRREILDPRPNYLGSDDGLATLAGMISRLDRHVGEVLDLLDELGIADNTIVIFTSDNGAQSGGQDNGWTVMTDYFEGNGPLRGYKGSFYEGGIRVPFVVRWTGRIPADAQTDQLMAFWDILPTLAEAAGVAPPEGLDGRSLLSVWEGGDPIEREGLYWEYPVRGGNARAARQGHWKIVQSRPGGPVELYDLSTDLGESDNIADRHPDIVARMIEYMDDSHQPPRDYPTTRTRPTVDDFVR